MSGLPLHPDGRLEWERNEEDGASEVRLPGIRDLESGIPPSYGRMLHDPFREGERLDPLSDRFRATHWKTVCHENGVQDKIARFVKFAMMSLYEDLPNETYDRIIRRQVEEYDASSFVLWGGLNTREHPLVIEAPGLLLPSVRVKHKGRFACFAISTESLRRERTIAVPGPTALMVLEGQQIVEGSGTKKLRNGELNPLHVENVIQLGPDSWISHHLNADFDPRTGTFLSSDRAIWTLRSQIRHTADGPTAPFNCVVQFVLGSERAQRLLRVILEGEMEARRAFVPAARQGPVM
ncbi:hypothetical protein JCM8547_008842 [Rhodosporidiobolus lusitaniae]